MLNEGKAIAILTFFGNIKENEVVPLRPVHEIFDGISSRARTRALSTFRGTKRLVSVNICSVEGNSADIFVSKVQPGIFAIKAK